MVEGSLPARIIIDADACPVTNEALQVARKHDLPVIIVGNSTQNLLKHARKSDPREKREGFWIETVAVGVGMDSADFAIIELREPSDIVVTQDIGLAAMVLGRGASAIGVRGREYLTATIDMDLEMRHVEKKVRRQGGRTGGPPPFTDEDKEHFAESLERMVLRSG